MEKAKQDAFDSARLQVIKDGYERAFECINKGLSVDESGDKTHALELYKQGRKHLLRAISVPSKGDDQAAGAVGGVSACSSKGLPLSPTRQPVGPVEKPPAYSPEAAEGHLSVSYGTDEGELSLVGEEFYSREVSAPSYPGYLRLVCDWLYPLMAVDSPVLLCNTGVFMFPDMMAPAPGYYVGVVLSAELSAAHRELFQDLLSQMTDLRVQAPKEAAETINLSQKVSIATPQETATGVTEEDENEEEKALPEWSASWLSWGLVKGAEFTGQAIHKGASKLREHITPEDRPTNVSPTVSKGLHVAKQATGGAVKWTGCAPSLAVGRELAPHVKKHGGKLIPESMKKDKDGRSNIDGAMVVAASGVQGFATMWTGLEVAAINITTSVASETVTTVKHKYGAAAGQATDNAVNSAINVGRTAFNVDNLGIQAIVKKTGKQTAHAILEDYKRPEKPNNGKQVEKSGK
ncbi:hypothetical protein F7725_020508 [Dissostichus mawsoni]|uniref:Senescence domain-containing protein n=1 Tax=Dissostichus mawsoni TaxID=36200 RepID=A0A7J5YDH6_DISMA|nr:hypothetical protein F7725_020508 [Dissostichus mawsoni]